jgi:hypothetical protein
MDRGQFDTLAKLIGTKQTRRTAVGALLGAALLGHGPVAVLAKAKDKSRDKATGTSAATATRCYPGTRCTPGRGSNASGCDFSGSTALFEGDFRGANLSHSNFTGAQLAKADFRGANLSGACLVGANLHAAKLGSSVNLDKAIFCRTLMPDGSINDEDCDKGTACCPTPPPICPEGEACEGDTCANTYNATCSVFGFIFPQCCDPLVCTPTIGSPLFTFCVLPCSKDETCERLVGPNSRCQEDLFGCPYLNGARCCSHP